MSRTEAGEERIGQVKMHMILSVLRIRRADCDCVASNMARFEIMSDETGVVPMRLEQQDAEGQGIE